jgi:hypothetical protein
MRPKRSRVERFKVGIVSSIKQFHRHDARNRVDHRNEVVITFVDRAHGWICLGVGEYARYLIKVLENAAIVSRARVEIVPSIGA